VKLKS